MKYENEAVQNAVENILQYYGKEASIGERVSANCQELAAVIASQAAKDIRSRGFTGGEALLADRFSEISAATAIAGCLPENRTLLQAKLAADEGAYLADLCYKTTLALSSTARLKPTPALFAERRNEESGGVVAFAESHVLKTAFSAFHKKDASLTPTYVHSFADACEDVASGSADYCILPIENSREGALLTVYGLIERYELFIARVCIIEMSGIVTKYALLCHGFCDIIEKAETQYVAVRLSGHDPLLWPRLYTGACVLGVEVVKTVSVPLGYTDGYAHICTFHGNSDTLFALLLFLATVRMDYTPIGTYEIIE